MISKERHRRIIDLVEKKQNISVQELCEVLEVSESTIRRDLILLDRTGKLMKVFGGASAVKPLLQTKDLSMMEKDALFLEEKRRIAAYAAGLVRPDDFVYLDAGTTTLLMTEYLTEANAVYVTNSIAHAKAIAQKGWKSHLLGGELKAVTEALVGSETLAAISRMYFTVGFFGTNGADASYGFTTPDLSEASVKRYAMQQTQRKYVLCDSSKIGLVSPVKFGEFENAVLLTDRIQKESYRKYENIVEVDQA